MTVLQDYHYESSCIDPYSWIDPTLGWATSLNSGPQNVVSAKNLYPEVAYQICIIVSH